MFALLVYSCWSSGILDAPHKVLQHLGSLFDRDCLPGPTTAHAQQLQAVRISGKSWGPPTAVAWSWAMHRGHREIPENQTPWLHWADNPTQKANSQLLIARLRSNGEKLKIEKTNPDFREMFCCLKKARRINRRKEVSGKEVGMLRNWSSWKHTTVKPYSR